MQHWSRPWRWNAVREHVPADWGYEMTVCIAGLADVGKSIVISCDSMISTSEFAGDRVAFKMYPLAAPIGIWEAMIAGNEISQVVPVIDRANSLLLALHPDSINAEGVGRAFADAYQSIRREYAQDQVLSPFGVTMAEFRSDGPRIFGDSYREVAADLMRVDLGCQFLLAGFDVDGDGHILSIENPGVVKNHDPVGFWAIGSGAFSALSALFFHSMRFDMPLAKVLYHVCEAKFMAESAFGVGKHTTVRIVTCDSEVSDTNELKEEMIENIRNAWQGDGRPRVPLWAIQKLEEMLKQFPSIARRSKPSASETSTD